jgi:hypothetical protein
LSFSRRVREVAMNHGVCGHAAGERSRRLPIAIARSSSNRKPGANPRVAFLDAVLRVAQQMRLMPTSA